MNLSRADNWKVSRRLMTPDMLVLKERFSPYVHVTTDITTGWGNLRVLNDLNNRN